MTSRKLIRGKLKYKTDGCILEWATGWTGMPFSEESNTSGLNLKGQTEKDGKLTCNVFPRDAQRNSKRIHPRSCWFLGCKIQPSFGKVLKKIKGFKKH